MKYLGKITDDKDLVTKEYVDAYHLGQNLIETDKVSRGAWLKNDGVLAATSLGCITTDFIPVKPGDIIHLHYWQPENTASGELRAWSGSPMYYKADKTYLSGYTSTYFTDEHYVFTETVPANCYFVRASYQFARPLPSHLTNANWTNSDYSAFKWKLEIGPEPTDWSAAPEDDTITLVKGNAETTYRRGQVNLTAANIGAAAASHTQSAATISSGYLNIHPENSPVVIPFMHNDIAHLLKRGGGAVVSYDGTTQSVDITNVLDGSGSYGLIINPTSLGLTELTIELTLHKTFAHSNWIYVDFGNASWRASGVTIEVMNTNYADDVWTSKYSTTTNALGYVAASISHIPVGASNAGGGFNKLRYTFTGMTAGSTTIFRIAQLGIYNYGSYGLRETYMSRGSNDELFRSLTPYATNTYDLGSSSKYWNRGYFNRLTVGGLTAASNTYADSNPKIVFANSGGSQSGSLTWTDYDSVQAPASLTLNGNQGGEYFIAPNIKATGSFYGNLSGTATKATQDGSGNTITTYYAPKSTAVTNVAYDSTNKKLTKTINGTTTDVVTVATLTSGLVPTTRKVNNKALSSDITLTASDVGAVSTGLTTHNGCLAKFSGDGVVVDGPTLGSSTTTFLRNDGTWATPPSSGSIPNDYLKGTGLANACLTVENGDGTIDSDVVTADRRINNKNLYNDIALSASDVGALSTMTAGSITSKSQSVSSSTSYSTIQSVSLEAGLYFFQVTASFPTSGTAQRRGGLRIVNGTSTTAISGLEQKLTLSTNGEVVAQVSGWVQPSSTTTYNFQVFQNSGAALTVAFEGRYHKLG